MTKEQYLELRSGLLELSNKLDKLYHQECNAPSWWNKWTTTPDMDEQGVGQRGYFPYSRDLELLTQGGNVVEGYVCFDNPPQTRIQYGSREGWQYGSQDLFQAWRYKE